MVSRAVEGEELFAIDVVMRGAWVSWQKSARLGRRPLHDSYGTETLSAEVVDDFAGGVGAGGAG